MPLKIANLLCDKVKLLKATYSLIKILKKSLIYKVIKKLTIRQKSLKGFLMFSY